MTLELFTAIGALFGGLVAFLLPERALQILFAGLLIYTSLTMARRGRSSGAATDQHGGPEEETLVEEPGDDPFFDTSLSGSTSRVRRVPFGAARSVGARAVSALPGIGGGVSNE